MVPHCQVSRFQRPLHWIFTNIRPRTIRDCGPQKKTFASQWMSACTRRGRKAKTESLSSGDTASLRAVCLTDDNDDDDDDDLLLKTLTRRCTATSWPLTNAHYRIARPLCTIIKLMSGFLVFGVYETIDNTHTFSFYFFYRRPILL